MQFVTVPEPVFLPVEAVPPEVSDFDHSHRRDLARFSFPIEYGQPHAPHHCRYLQSLFRFLIHLQLLIFLLFQL